MARIIDTRRATALFKDAAISPPAEEFLGAVGMARPVHALMGLIAMTYGGRWVDGNAELTSEELIFEPSALSRKIYAHSEALRMELPLGEIRSVTTHSQVITGTIDVAIATGNFSLSCMGFETFAQEIRDAAGLR